VVIKIAPGINHKGRRIVNNSGFMNVEIIQIIIDPSITPITEPINPNNPASRVQLRSICLSVNPKDLRIPISFVLSDKLKPMVFIIPRTPINNATLAKPSKIYTTLTRKSSKRLKS
jgi:hypothetical protein